jgi:hypothetical protein
MKIDGSVALGVRAGARRERRRGDRQHALDQIEVLADEPTRFVKASLPRDHELIYPPVQSFWDAAVTGS